MRACERNYIGLDDVSIRGDCGSCDGVPFGGGESARKAARGHALPLTCRSALENGTSRPAARPSERARMARCSTGHRAPSPRRGLDRARTAGRASCRSQSPPAIMDQSGYEFLPALLVAQAGQTVEFRNSEDVLHNVRVTDEATPARVQRRDGRLRPVRSQVRARVLHRDVRHSHDDAREYPRHRVTLHGHDRRRRPLRRQQRPAG